MRCENGSHGPEKCDPSQPYAEVNDVRFDEAAPAETSLSPRVPFTARVPSPPRAGALHGARFHVCMLT